MDDLNSMIRADGTWRIKLLSIDRVGAEVIGEIEEFAECQGIEIGESKKKGSLTGLTIKTIEAIESALGKRIRKFSEINGTETRMKLLQALPPQTASELTEFLELKKLGPAKYRKERSLD